MIPVDGKNLAVLIGAATAVAVAAYVVWGPPERRQQRRNKKGICPGLVNLGNTCFMNAVLQALAPCASVAQWLANLSETKRSASQCLATTLYNVIKVLNNDSVEYREEYSLTDVIRSLSAHGWVISPEEQDAHEMFHVLTETLNDETTRVPSVSSLFDVSRLQDTDLMSSDEARNRINTSLPVLERSSADNPFHGLLASQLTCKRCGFKCAIKYDHFDSLSLTIPAHNMGPLTVESLLKNYVLPETVEGVTCEKCSTELLKAANGSTQGSRVRSNDKLDTFKSNHIKQMTIGKLPHCLCIHIQRTAWLNNGVPMKRFDRVAFPEVLCMTPYIYQKKDAHTMRPKTLELDVNGSLRLVGGKDQKPIKSKNELRPPSSAKSPASSPMMSMPYSSCVNMLKALNYHTRLSQDGLHSLSPSKEPAESNRDQSLLDRNGYSSLPMPRQVRRLAQAYCSETADVLTQLGGAGNGAYKLTAVIVHLGDASSGHFVTYRRAPSINGQRFPAQWLYTSDVVVKIVSLATVLASDAYMLFYEKI